MHAELLKLMVMPSHIRSTVLTSERLLGVNVAQSKFFNSSACNER